MQFCNTVKGQLSALKAKFPEKSYQTIEQDEDAIGREYRREILKPELAQLIDKQVCKPGRVDAEKYEDACLEIIKWTLGQELDGGDPEHHLSTFLLDGFSRKIRDITLPVPQTVLPTKWESIKIEHELRSIVFECKNYVESNPLTNVEIYQLFEYINPDQHGTLGILLSRFGKKSIHKNVNSALNKIFNLDQNPKYRIIILSDDDIIQMIEEYVEFGTCVHFLAREIEKSRSLPI